MAAALQDQLDWQTLAMRAARIQGSIPIANLPRVADVVGSVGGEVTADLRFSRLDNGQPVVTGHIEADLELVCQRCLEIFRRDIGSDFELLLVQTDGEMGFEREGLQAWLADDERLKPADLIEDELLLALPDVPVHEKTADCGRLVNRIATYSAHGVEDAYRPFDVLKDLKTQD